MYMRNVKNEEGVWEQVAAYNFEEPEPFGHGEKSVFLISKFIPKKEAAEMPAESLKNIRLHLCYMLRIWRRHLLWMTRWSLKSKKISAIWAAGSSAAYIFLKNII